MVSHVSKKMHDEHNRKNYKAAKQGEHNLLKRDTFSLIVGTRSKPSAMNKDKLGILLLKAYAALTSYGLLIS